MQQNVYIISLVGISVVFVLLMALYFVMKAFKYLPTTTSKTESKIKKKKNTRKKAKPSANQVQKISSSSNRVQDDNVIAIITAVMSKKGINQDRITIKK